jgi:ADP-ribose pyrophosphatase YjhB (NUDIX family)
MIPQFCGRCGGSLHEREVEGSRRLVCGQCGQVTYRNPVPAAGCVVAEGGQVLLARRRHAPWQGSWYFPSGFVEYDEPVEETARRETREETGLEVELGGVFGVWSYFDDPRQNGIIILYRARPIGGALAAGDDAAEVQFFQRDRLPPDGEVGFLSHRLALAQWRAEG